MTSRNNKMPGIGTTLSVDAGELFARVHAILARARVAVYVAANTAMVEAYWNVGREIVEKQGGAARAKYGDGLIKALSVRLTTEFGEGFTASNLKYMRQVYLAFPNRHTLCDQLTWSHYRTLASVEDEKARNYYFGECIKSHWSVRGEAIELRESVGLKVSELRRAEEIALERRDEIERKWHERFG